MAENPSGWWSRLTPARRDSGTPARAPRTGADSAGTDLLPARTAGRPAVEAAPYVPGSVRTAAAWAWRLLVIAAASALVGYLIITFKLVVVAFVIALLLAVLLDPVATWLRKRLRFPRALAALTTIVLMLGVVTTLLTLAGRSIIGGFADLASQATAGFSELLDWLTSGPLAIGQTQLDTWIEEGLGQLEANSGVLVSGALGAATSAGQIVTGALIALFCLFFFLKEGRRIWQWFVRLAPVPSRERINEAGIRGWLTLGGYTRTQILVAFVDSVGIGIGAAILGLPLVLPLTILVFLGSFIPIIGALVSGSVAVLVALVDQDVKTALIMLGIVLLVQQVEGNLLQPWLMGNAVSLHPVAVLLAVTAGTGVAGILGALLSVPIAGVVNTVVLYLHGHDKHPKAATDWHRPGGPPGILFRSIADSYGGDQTGALAAAIDADDDEKPASPDRAD
ncbi:AI-2E family transporter [Georgenia sunbinii]|uniref:AI-2E family transporter n=1 Tax=Georgenia sunbinii TaxID=3117728 RepID=UPI002F260A96